MFAQCVKKGLSKTMKNLGQDRNSGLRSKPGTSQIRTGSITHSKALFCANVHGKLPQAHTNWN